MLAMLWAATLLVFWSCGGEFLLFGDDFPLPPLEGATQYGCISLTLLDRSVRATAWVNYDDAHLEAVRKNHFSLELQKEYPHRGWAHLISIRSGKKADQQSALDCVLWNRGMRQALLTNLKEKK